MLIEAQADEKLIAQLFGNQPDSVVWFAPVFNGPDESLVVDFTVKYCNAAAGKILKADPSKVIGTRLLGSGLMDSTSINLIFEQCSQVWSTQESIEFTYYSPGFDKYFNVQRSKVMHGVLSITRDRTLEVKAEREKETQSILLNKIVNNSPASILLCQAIRDQHQKITDFRLLMVNDTIANELGKRKDEIEGQTYCSLHPAIRPNGLMDILSKAAQTGERFSSEMHLPDLGGWCLFTVDKVDDDKIIITYQNIDTTKTASQKIEEQARLLTLMLNSSLNGVYTLEAIREKHEIVDFRISHVNEVFCRMSGRKHEDLIGKRFGEVFPDTKKSGIFERNCNVLKTGISLRQEFHYTGDGVDRWYQNSVNKVTDDQIVIAFHDVTPLKKAAVDLERANAELKKSNERLTDFTHIASHDLNEPLRKITTYIDVIEQRLKSEVTPGVQEYLSRISRTAHRMQELVTDLLTYSKISHLSEEFTAVHLDTVIRDVQTDLETAISGKQAKIKVDKLPVIKGNHTQLAQVFQNLISNALKFQKEGNEPVIKIKNNGTSVNEGRTYYWVSVSDNGIGFDQADAEKIFNVFHRLHSKHDYEGTGIGLAIVQRAMENHNGFVTVRSTPGQGATFNLFFPILD